MKISPISFGKLSLNKTPITNTDSVKLTQRQNSLADMEFNIIKDTIRCQNLKNQMNVRLMNLKHILNNCTIKNV